MSHKAIRRWSMLGVFVLMAASGPLAQETSRQQAASGDAEPQVKAAQRQLLNASIQGDKQAVGNLLADDVTWVLTTGKVNRKDDVLAMLPAPVRDVGEQQVKVLGEFAIVTAVANMKDGTRNRVLQQWVKQDQQWKLMAHNSAAIAPASGQPTGTSGTAATSRAAREGSVEPGMRGEAPDLKSDDERGVWEAHQALHDAFLNGDAEKYSKYTADEYVRVMPDGIYRKADFVKTVKGNAGKPGGRLEVSDVQIDVQGNVARIVSKTWGQLPGGQAVPPSRATRIYEKRDGRWQQVAAGFTPIAEK